MTCNRIIEVNHGFHLKSGESGFKFSRFLTALSDFGLGMARNEMLRLKIIH